MSLRAFCKVLIASICITAISSAALALPPRQALLKMYDAYGYYRGDGIAVETPDPVYNYDVVPLTANVYDLNGLYAGTVSYDGPNIYLGSSLDAQINFATGSELFVGNGYGYLGGFYTTCLDCELE